MKRTLYILLAVIVIAIVGVCLYVPADTENRMNPVLNAPPYQASPDATALHKRLLVADMHADSLLWGRDLNQRGTRGQVDVPRLIDGNVALQAFTIVSKSPRNMNIESNDDSTDNITPLAVVSLWPVSTWGSLKQRALYQSAKLHAFAAASGGRLTVIDSAAGLGAYLARRAKEPAITAGLLGVEGAQVLEGNAANVDALFDAGIRMMGPAHFFDNEISGSAHGVHKGGLTATGREVIKRMEAKKMLVDLAHSSPQTIDDVLAMATRPVVVSHTGVKGTCNNARNLSDAHVKGIAATGGVIGIGYWETAVCGTDAAAVARAIKYAVGIAGVEHVGLGSDYDGSIKAPFDTSGVVLVTEALLKSGFSEKDIASIMGGNYLRLLGQTLP
jgi:microsomal dipeptidase-like Zn-dependent dipeptidase